MTNHKSGANCLQAHKFTANRSILRLTTANKTTCGTPSFRDVIVMVPVLAIWGWSGGDLITCFENENHIRVSEYILPYFAYFLIPSFQITNN